MTHQLIRVAHWHRPLMVISAAMALLALVALAGVLIDPRVLTGAPIWLKPFKFAVSFAIYSLTLAWMLSQLSRRSRVAEHAATVVVVTAAVEMTVVVGQVVRGRPSHFNASTPLDSRLWDSMGVLIMILWLAHLVIAVVLARRPLADRTAAYGIRLGLAIAVLGMLAAVPMVLPSADPDIEGITGAHSVGVADGGAGMPVTGWSLEGGDLRVGHFVGMHGLQALPLLALGLSVLAGRSRRARARLDERTRVLLLLIAAGAYTVLTGLLTVQALRGQPLLRPDALTLGAFAVLVAVTAAATVAALGRRPAGPAAEPELEPAGVTAGEATRTTVLR